MSTANPALVVFDFDGTLADHRGGWSLLFKLFGTEERGNDRTEAYRAGELSFREWCDANVADWREHEVTRSHVENAADAVKMTAGAENLLAAIRARNIPWGIISSGFVDLMTTYDRFEPTFTIANELEYDTQGVVEGVSVAVGPDDKDDRLREVCDIMEIDPEEVVYIGDSYSDTEAFEVAGTAILFDPDPRLDQAAHDTVDIVVDARNLWLIAEHVFVDSEPITPDLDDGRRSAEHSSMEALQTDDAPASIGPFSQGIRDGNTVYVSGQGPVDPDTDEVVGGDVRIQTAQTLDNIAAVLAVVGASLDDIVKATVFVTDMADYEAVNEVYAKYVSPPYPARSAVEVADLPIDINVEIEVIASLAD